MANMSIGRALRSAISVNGNLGASGGDANVVSALISSGIGRALSMDCDIPSSPVSSIRDHYYRNFATQVNERIAEIHESYTLDVSLTQRLTEAFYTLRYRLVHEPRFYFLEIGALASSLPEYFPTEVCEVLKTEIGKKDESGQYTHLWCDVVDIVNTAIQAEKGVIHG